MMTSAEEIAAHLRESTGSEFEQAVCAALHFLGLDATWTGADEAEVDVLAKSVDSPVPYKLVCECCAARQGSEVDVEKVGQIRSNGPKHENKPEALYLSVVGRPKFSRNAIKNSNPNVCLILAEDLALLVQNHAVYGFWNVDLQKVFISIGESNEVVNQLLETNRKRVERKTTAAALICVAAERFAKEQGQTVTTIEKNLLLITARAYGETLGFGIFSFDEMVEALAFLASPVANILATEGDTVVLRGTVFKNAVSRIARIGSTMELIFSEGATRLQKALNRAILNQ